MKPLRALRRRLTSRSPLFLVQFNRGDRATFEDIVALLAGNDALALCEMYDQERTLNRLEEAGFGVWRGEGGASKATPVVWNKDRIDVDRKWSVLLLPAATRGGIRNMAKYVNYISGIHVASGRRINIASAHQIQTLHTDGRIGAAEEFNRNLARSIPRRGATFVGIDGNVDPDQSVYERATKPIRPDPMRSTQDDPVDRVATRGKRAIDTWLWRDRRTKPGVVEFIRQWTGDANSDHRPLFARFSLRDRPQGRAGYG